MAAHNWRRVGASVFHAFHTTWMGQLQTALNTGILPTDFYAMCEQQAGDIGPDVLTLQHESSNGDQGAVSSNGGIATLAQKPPKVHVVQTVERDFYTRKRKTLVIRHTSDERIIAMIEIVSPGNKASTAEFRRFVDKAIGALHQGIHLLIVDLFPPGKRDPEGIHGALWAECGESYVQPVEKPLTLVSYSVDVVKTAFVEPFTVGDALTSMPLFLDPESYVEVPLETTYQAAYVGVPRHYREMLEK